MTLCNIIVECRDYMEHFNRHEYVEYYNRFYEMAVPVIEAVEDPRAAAAELIDSLEAEWAKEKRFRVRRLQTEKDKLTICCYLNPVATSQELSRGRELAEAIHEIWIERYPKDPYEIGTYEQIMKGFEPRLFGFKISRD